MSQTAPWRPAPAGRALLLGLALSLLPSLAACTCDAAASARAFAGADARDCTREAPEESASCALAAQAAGQPFWAAEVRQGRDVGFTLAFARSAAGESASFRFDSLGGAVGATGAAGLQRRTCARFTTDAQGLLDCESPGAPETICR